MGLRVVESFYERNLKLMITILDFDPFVLTYFVNEVLVPFFLLFFSLSHFCNNKKYALYCILFFQLLI